MPSFFSEGNTPKVQDTRWRALEKILGATVASAGGFNGGVTNAASAPPVDGSITTLFFRNSGTGQKYLNVGTVAVPAWEAI